VYQVFNTIGKGITQTDATSHNRALLLTINTQVVRRTFDGEFGLTDGRSDVVFGHARVPACVLGVRGAYTQRVQLAFLARRLVRDVVAQRPALFEPAHLRRRVPEHFTLEPRRTALDDDRPRQVLTELRSSRALAHRV